MRIPTSLLTAGLALALVVGACNDDTDVDAGDEPAGDDAADGAVDATAPDIVGTITSVDPFVPVTEDCTPPEDLDPDGAVSSDDPPICTPEGTDVLGTILVEEEPDDPQGGRKISFTATSETQFQGDGPEGVVVSFDDLAEGQQVRAWVSGDACAESYPEQCGLQVVHVTG